MKGFRCPQCGADSTHRKEFEIHPKPLRDLAMNVVFYLVMAAVAWGLIQWMTMPVSDPAPPTQSTSERRQYDDYGDDDEYLGDYDPDDPGYYVPHGY